MFDGVRLVNRELAGLRFDLGGVSSRAGSTDRLLVRFLTPTELKGGGELVDRSEFGILVRRLRDRISNLCVFYQGGALEVEYVGEMARFLEFFRVAARVGVGRQTVWGKGCLAVVTTDGVPGKSA